MVEFNCFVCDSGATVAKRRALEGAAVPSGAQTLYQEAIGALMYAAMGTWPDIAFAVSTLAQYSENPGWTHWEVVKQVFRYLLGTPSVKAQIYYLILPAIIGPCKTSNHCVLAPRERGTV